MSDTLHYLAYGSNLHPLRLGERIPSSRSLGLVSLPDWSLHFHKRGSDGSGKCNLLRTSGAVAWGAVYAMDASERPILDEIEGAGYAIHELTVEFDGAPLDCFVYLAETDHIDDRLLPRAWYREIVWLGAQHRGLPGPYCDRIAAVPDQPDPDAARAEKNRTLIERLKRYDGARD